MRKAFPCECSLPAVRAVFACHVIAPQPAIVWHNLLLQQPDRRRKTTMSDAPLNNENTESNSLTKAQLAELLYERLGLSKRESKDVVDAFFERISHTLIGGQDVKISGFGNFQIRTKASRPGRNPRTGEVIPIDARRVVTFHASNKLKEQVQPAS